jgi:uncharacterized protein YecE (DUF72 family)
MPVRVGTAAWAIPRGSAGAFPTTGSVLERYAAIFDAVEINSSVPPAFRFAVKVPKAITHEARLRACGSEISAFVDEVSHLGDRLGPLLLQLPPSLAFDGELVDTACTALARAPGARVVCEPRHASWFTPAVDGWLAERAIARVAADPARGPRGAEPGGWTGLAYYRLHGSPKVYYSPYPAEEIAALAAKLPGGAAAQTWCIFDNTALGHATQDALALRQALG